VIDLVLGLAAIAWMVACTWRLVRPAPAESGPDGPASAGQASAPRCPAPPARRCPRRAEPAPPAERAPLEAAPADPWAAYRAPACRRLGRSPDLRPRW